MGKGFFHVPVAVNEPVKSYEPGSPEREEVLLTYKDLYNTKMEVPLYIGSKQIKSGDTATMHPPHDHKHDLGVYHKANKKHVQEAIDTALEARKEWANLEWEQRAAVFLKAADLIAGPYRARINASLLYTSDSAHEIQCVSLGCSHTI